MAVAKVAGVFANRALFATTGLRPAGRALVRALGSEHEDVRAVAGMSLVQSGERAEPLLAEAAERRENLPLVLTILGDIGDPACEPLLERYTRDADPEVARSAHEALRVLHAKRDPAHPG